MTHSPMTPQEIAALPYRLNAGMMLANERGRIFAGQRIDTPGDAWQMPQGGIDAGENPAGAALRELEEEIGVPPEQVTILAEMPEWLSYDLPVDLVPRIWKGRYRGQSQRWFLMRFLGQDAQINIATAHPEFSHWRWMQPDELLTHVVPFKRDVYGTVLRAFQPHL